MLLIINTGISGRGENLITYFTIEPKILYLQFHTTFGSDKYFQLVHIKQEGTARENDIYIDILITYLQELRYSGTRRCVSL